MHRPALIKADNAAVDDSSIASSARNEAVSILRISRSSQTPTNAFLMKIAVRVGDSIGK